MADLEETSLRSVPSPAAATPVLQYSIGGDQACWHEPWSRYSFPKGQKLYGESWDLIADELAEDYHVNHDGWEATWPLQLRIYKDDIEVARFTVEREYEPRFTAWEIDLPVSPAGCEAEGVVSSNTGDPS